MTVKRLTQLQQIAGLRERRALRECQMRHQLHLVASQAREDAEAVVSGLRQAREDVMTQMWSGATTTGQDLQTAIQCADHLAQQQKIAQRKVVQAEAVEAEAEARWIEARGVQAAAMRTCHKLDHAHGVEAAVERRDTERRTALRHDDDGLSLVAARGAAGR